MARKTLERVCQSLFSRYNQVLGVLGANDLEVEHIAVRSSQKGGDLPVNCKFDQDTFRAALDWWCDSEESESE